MGAEANIKSLRRVYAGWERGDFTTSESLMDKNVVLVVTPSFPTEGVWVGLDGLKQHTAQVLDAWESLTMAAESYTEAGDSVLVNVLQRGSVPAAVSRPKCATSSSGASEAARSYGSK